MARPTPRSTRPAARGARPPAAAAPARAALPPPLWRDPWAAAVALAMLPLLAALRDARPGEPFADDFLFLDFSVLRGNPSWWDGGGGEVYWRPLARQAYFGLFGPLALAHPLVLAALHALALAAAALLVYRALRRTWPAPAAAAAGAFPLWLEAARVLVAWPSGAQDLGALLLLALALHAAARGRLVVLALAAAGAALCKEVAAPLAALVAVAPLAGAPSVRRRALALAAALAPWAIARFALPHGHVLALGALASPEAARVPLALRLLAALPLAARDAFGLAPDVRFAGALGALALACAALSLVWLAAPRARAAAAWRWSAWGLAWFAAGTAPLALFLPDWAPFRSVLPAVGLGVALVAPLAYAARAWLLPLLAVRLAALVLAPQPPPRIDLDVSSAGEPMAYPRLALLQRGAADVHRLLARVAPHVPAHGRVARESFPRMTGVAFAGDLALRTWYRDTTLRWATTGELREGRVEDVAAMIEFEPYRSPQWVSIDLPAIREAVGGVRALRAGRYADGLPLLARARAEQRDSSAAQFLASLEGWRAMAQYDLGRPDSAEASAALALGHFPGNSDARLVLARVRAGRGDWRGSYALARQQLRLFPRDADARALLDEAARHLGRPPG